MRAMLYDGTAARLRADGPGFTGYTLDGGYAERMVADSDFCRHLPQRYFDVEAAPLLCAGLIASGPCAWQGTPGGSASSALAPRRISSPSLHVIKARRSKHLPVPAKLRHSNLHCTSAPTGWQHRRTRAGRTRCRVDLRPGRRARAPCLKCGLQGWCSGLWRHPHERLPVLSVLAPLG